MYFTSTFKYKYYKKNLIQCFYEDELKKKNHAKIFLSLKIRYNIKMMLTNTPFLNFFYPLGENPYNRNCWCYPHKNIKNDQ